MPEVGSNKAIAYPSTTIKPAPARGPVLVVAFLIGILCLGLFTSLAYDVTTSGTVSFDTPFIQAAQSHTSPIITALMKVITVLGSPAFLITLAFVATTYLLRRPLPFLYGILPASAILGAWHLNTLIKESFGRLRPGDNPLVYESGFSFPSGHAMISLAFYGAIAYLIWKYASSPIRKWFFIIGLGVLVLLIGLSRIYLGVHYPSDVAGGYAAGGLWLLLCLGGVQKWGKIED